MIAFQIALPGFLIPYIFVYNTSLLLEGPLWEIIWRTCLTIVGTVEGIPEELGPAHAEDRSLSPT